MYSPRGLADVMCPDGSMIADGALCPSQAPPASSPYYGLPVAYGPASSPSATWVSGIPNSYVLIGAGILGVLLLVKRR